MLIAWVKRIENSKYTRWLAGVAFLLLILTVILDGQLWITIESLLLILGLFVGSGAGIVLGGALARIISRQLLNQSAGFDKRLASTFSLFGFLFLPPLFGSLANTYLNTNLEMLSLGAHFLWAFLAGCLYFVIGDSASKY